MTEAGNQSTYSQGAIATQDWCVSTPLKRVLVLQLIDRQPHRCLELLALPMESSGRLGPLAFQTNEAICRNQPTRQFQQVRCCCLQILRLGGISNPHSGSSRSAQFRLPIDFALQELPN